MFPHFWLLPPRLLWPGGVEWVRNATAGFILVALTPLILSMQYRRRRTPFSRALALVAAVLGAAVYWWMPWRLGFVVQSWLSKQPSAGVSVQVAFDPAAKIAVVPQYRSSRAARPVEVHLPITVSGVPAGLDVRADALAVTLQSMDGRTWKAGLGAMNRRRTSAAISKRAGFGWPTSPGSSRPCVR